MASSHSDIDKSAGWTLFHAHPVQVPDDMPPFSHVQTARWYLRHCPLSAQHRHWHRWKIRFWYGSIWFARCHRSSLYHFPAGSRRLLQPQIRRLKYPHTLWPEALRLPGSPQPYQTDPWQFCKSGRTLSPWPDCPAVQIPVLFVLIFVLFLIFQLIHTTQWSRHAQSFPVWTLPITVQRSHKSFPALHSFLWGSLFRYHRTQTSTVFPIFFCHVSPWQARSFPADRSAVLWCRSVRSEGNGTRSHKRNQVPPLQAPHG